MSALTFALTTVGVKFLGEANWPSFTVIWGRFALGISVLAIYHLCKNQSIPKMNKARIVILRATTNFIAVSFFYLSVYFTTLLKANLLNMTYPIFIAILGPIILKEKSNRYVWMSVACCTLGVMAIVGPAADSWVIGDLYGLICGILASVSIMSLRAARQYDDSATILFYVMLFGSLGLLPFVEIPQTLSPTAIAVFAITSAGGLLGQYFLTHAYGFVSAIAGAVTSSTRVLFSGLFGLMFFGESLSLGLIAGAVLILLSTLLVRLKPTTS